MQSAYGNDIADKLIQSYTEVENSFAIRKWKPSELDAGHFVEVVRRIIEIELNLKRTPFSQSLIRFDEREIKRYQDASGDIAFRQFIPRILWSVYNIRNKRGVGHVPGLVSANEMDSTLILYSIKWVLSEIVRLKSNLSIEDTQQIVNQITERQIPLLWKNGSLVRVQYTGLKTEEEVLVLLFYKDEQLDVELFESIEYKNEHRFKKEVLTEKLHKTRLITYREGECMLMDTGRIEAERIIQKFAVGI
ncbi:hypothetical protein JXR01_01170 [Candidatus Kaiserbacteria bacterium]|nr:MAG: hypothetical protein JXR01_01170 [Candidatus Kaiserbacteria bacterium]